MSIAQLYHDWLIFPKVLYFVFNIVNYALHTFQNQVIKDRWGLGAKEIGFPLSLQVFSFIGSLYWTWFADKSGRFKIITSCATVCFTAAFLLIFMDTNLLITKDEKILLICAVFAFSSFFNAALFPIMDAIVMALLSSVPGFNKDMFGRQRLWGAIGHFAATASSEIIIQYSFDFLKYLVIISGGLLVLIIVFMIPNHLSLEIGHHHHHAPKKDEKAGQPAADAAVQVAKEHQQPAKVSSPVIYLLTKPAFLFFLLFIVVAGIARSVMTNYGNYFVYNVFQRKYYATFLGAVRLFSEVSVYFCNKDLSMFLGPYWMLILSQLAAVVRSTGYGLIPANKDDLSYLYCIPLELFKGLNSGLVTAGAVRIASEMAPPGGASTAQGLFSGVFVGLSNFLGGQMASVLMSLAAHGTSELEQIGQLFLITGFALLFFTVCFLVKYACVDKVILQGGSKKH